MTAAHQAYAGQRLAAEGPFQTGLDPGQHPARPDPSGRSARTRLIATRQGIITSLADAEWLLVRTAARIDYQARNAPASPYQPDQDDLLTLSRALAGMAASPPDRSSSSSPRGSKPGSPRSSENRRQLPNSAAAMGTPPSNRTATWTSTGTSPRSCTPSARPSQ